MGNFLFRWLCHFVAGGTLPSFPPHFFFRGTSTRNEYEKKCRGEWETGGGADDTAVDITHLPMTSSLSAMS